MTRTFGCSLHGFCALLDRFVAIAAVWALLSSTYGCRREAAGTPETSGPLFPALLGAGWGYIDNGGRTMIAPRFESALPFSEGFAAVKHEGRWGYINRQGTEIVPFRYRTAQSFRGGVAIVDSGLPEHPVGVIDASGSWIVPPMFRSLSAADGPDGLLLGQKEPAEGLGFYDRAGKVVLGPYTLAFPFSEGRARVRQGSNDRIIDASGNFLTKDPVVLDGIRFKEGRIAIRIDRKLGYMDLKGNVAIDPRFDQGGEFSEGLAPVQLEGRWMFIDRSGAMTAQLPADVAFAEPLSDGLSLVSAGDEHNRHLGYVDRNGQWVIKGIWDDAEPFHDGLAYVGIWKGEKTAYIDHTGKRVWQGNAQP